MHFNNYDLAFAILDELINLKIRRNVFGFNCEFSLEELSQIKKLVLKNANSLEEINLLPNLKEINIYSEYSDNSEYLDDNFYNHITDFTPLESLSNLEVLRIYNDFNLHSLDVIV